MNYRTFGQTGLRVSSLAFGGSPLGGVFGDVDETEGARAVHLALDLGINLFDTAPYYGATRAEQVLGRALQGISRDRFVLGTKVGRYGADNFDYSATRVSQSLDESLERLRVDHVDLLQVHDIEFGSVEQIVSETIPALLRLRDAGKARFIGVSGLHLHLLADVAECADIDFVQTYCHGTLYDTTALGWWPTFESLGVACLNSAPLGMGLLTNDEPPEWHPAPTELRRVCRAAAEHCRARGANLAAVALYFSAHLPGVASTVVGMAHPRTVRENVAALATAPDPTLLAEIRAILAVPTQTSWPSGRKENQPCT